MTSSSDDGKSQDGPPTKWEELEMSSAMRTFASFLQESRETSPEPPFEQGIASESLEEDIAETENGQVEMQFDAQLEVPIVPPKRKQVRKPAGAKPANGAQAPKKPRAPRSPQTLKMPKIPKAVRRARASTALSAEESYAFQIVSAISRDKPADMYKLFESHCTFKPDTEIDRCAPLALASKLGKMAVVKRLLEDPGVSLDRGSPNALMLAAANGHVEVAKLLAGEMHNRGLNINARTVIAGRTAFFYAVASNNTAVIDVFLKLHRDGVIVDFSVPDLTDEQRSSANIDPFLAPSEAAKSYVRTALRELGIDLASLGCWILPTDERPDLLEAERKELLLREAARIGDVKTVTNLVKDATFDINGTDQDGITALMIACYYGHLDIVKLILSQAARADPNKRDRWGRTAYMYAGAKSHNEFMRCMARWKYYENIGGKWVANIYAVDHTLKDKFEKSAPFLDLEGMSWADQETTEALHLEFYLRLPAEEHALDLAEDPFGRSEDFAMIRASNPERPPKRESAPIESVEPPSKKPNRDNELKLGSASTSRPSPPAPLPPSVPQKQATLPTPGPSQPSSPELDTPDYFRDLQTGVASQITEVNKRKRRRDELVRRMAEREERLKELRKLAEEQEEDERELRAEVEIIKKKEDKVDQIRQKLEQLKELLL